MWRNVPAVIFVFCLLGLRVTAQEGLNGLTEIEFDALSHKDRSVFAQKALSLHPEQWKHAETEHFVYHFVRGFVASRVAVEAEFYFRFIAKQLERDEPAGAAKSHIYIFDRDEDWAQFQAVGSLEQWTGGIQHEGSLFLLRNPAYKFADNTLGHEIAHLILHRAYGRNVPLWLNEGFAEYVSRAGYASFHRARGYRAKPWSDAIAPESLLPTETLLAARVVPSANVELFYRQSERLVRFLVSTEKGRFLALLDALGRRESFEPVFLRTYGGAFASRNDFDEKFAAYASKDFGTTLPDEL